MKWPWQKKKKVVDVSKRREKEMDELKAFRSIGERFIYLGVTMIVCDLNCRYREGRFSAELEANYVNKHGDVKLLYFAHSELLALIAENGRK